MKILCSALLGSAAILSFAQGHNLLQGAGMKEIAFLQGDWHGTQTFKTDTGSMDAGIVNHIQEAVGGRYLEEKLATTLPGQKPTDVRHFITFDPKTKIYRAWWFNDTSVGPMELEGGLQGGNKLVLESKPGGTPGAPVFRATYANPSPDKLEYSFELKTAAGWRLLFTSSYQK